MDKKNEVSDGLFLCIKYFIICLALAIVAYKFACQAEAKAFEAGKRAQESFSLGTPAVLPRKEDSHG